MLEKTRTIVCSEQAVDHIRARVPLDAEVIIAHRRLDAGGIEMLRDLLSEIDGRGRDRA